MMEQTLIRNQKSATRNLSFSLRRYVWASLRHYRRIHLAVAAGVALATAIVTGALLVGDSMRGSLRDLTHQRLGQIDSVLVSTHTFRQALADEIASESTNHGSESQPTAPLLLTQGMLSRHTDLQLRTATGLSVVGCTNHFWRLGVGGPSADLPPDTIALGKNIALELGVLPGDEVILRVPRITDIPAESSLGEKEDRIASRRMTVCCVLAAEGLARFGLQPSQQQERNVFLPLATLQDLLELANRINAVAVPGPAVTIRPRLADFGLRVERISLDGGPLTGTVAAKERPAGNEVPRRNRSAADSQATPQEYLLLTSNQLVLNRHVVDTVQREFGTARTQPAITYLANRISAGSHTIPYSTICGIDSSRELGPLLDRSGNPVALTETDIVLNDWAARELHVAVGDQVTVTYYEPESTHGKPREHLPPLPLRVQRIVPLLSDDGETGGRPTMAADRHLAPELKGVTDQSSMDDWNLPFKLVEKIRPQDERYWDQYAATPKAFVAYRLAERLWQTPWGATTAIRIPKIPSLTAERFRQRLRQQLDPNALGMTWIPVKQQGLKAAAGTTPFDGLFLGFSFFLVASAVMLVHLLFRMGIDGRASEVGTLLAIGIGQNRLLCAMLSEMLLVASMGALVGMVAGVAYGWLMIHGLNTWWVEATVTPFLRLHRNPNSMLAGFLSGIVVAAATIGWSLRRFVRVPAKELLTGTWAISQDYLPVLPSLSRGRRLLPVLAFGLAALLTVIAMRWEGETQAGAFFGSACLVLTGMLTAMRHNLLQPPRGKSTPLSLTKLAWQNARRKANRTTLTVGLTAIASFLIIAISAFRLQPTESGTGHFAWVATSDMPIHFDMNTAEGRRELGLARRTVTPSTSGNKQPSATEPAVDGMAVPPPLEGVTFHAFRVQPGEDASCLNLYQPLRPRLLGVPQSFVRLNRFAWTNAEVSRLASAKNGQPTGREKTYADPVNPWLLLDSDLGRDAAGQVIVPVVVDRNTAYYSLKRYHLGAQLTIRDAANRPVTLQIVGMLSGSMLQGDLLIGQDHFQRLFPDIAGARFFLLDLEDKPMADRPDIATTLETGLEEYGFDMVRCSDRLASFMTVQNTYLSTFQSLGGLGLLLGTVGLALVQVRAVLERRGELALLRSVGMTHRQLARLVLTESCLLLLGGLGIGSISSIVAVLPHLLSQQAEIPWVTLGTLLMLILLAGIATSWLAAKAVLQVPLLPALRGD
jgi:putative ABC transport system permease protein